MAKVITRKEAIALLRRELNHLHKTAKQVQKKAMLEGVSKSELAEFYTRPAVQIKGSLEILRDLEARFETHPPISELLAELDGE